MAIVKIYDTPTGRIFRLSHDPKNLEKMFAIGRGEGSDIRLGNFSQVDREAEKSNYRRVYLKDHAILRLNHELGIILDYPAENPCYGIYVADAQDRERCLMFCNDKRYLILGNWDKIWFGGRPHKGYGPVVVEINEQPQRELTDAEKEKQERAEIERRQTSNGLSLAQLRSLERCPTQGKYRGS